MTGDLEYLDDLEERDTKPRSSKKLIAIAICCFVFICSVIITTLLVVLLNNKNPDTFDISNATIANFSEYKALGIGNKQDNTNTPNTFSYNNPDNNNNINDNKKLIGVKHDNTIDEIKFKKDDKQIEQKWDVYDLQTYGRFTFIIFKTKDSLLGYGDHCPIVNSKYAKTFIVDNKTGKIYSSEIIGNGLFINKTDLKYNDDVLYIVYSIYTDNTPSGSIYKLSIENENLKFEEIVKRSQLKYGTNAVVDKYGNLILPDASTSGYNVGDAQKFGFVITNNKTLKTIDPNNNIFFKAVNGILYSEDLSKKINENGEIVENSDTVGQLNYNSKSFKYLTTINNCDYYFQNQDVLEYDETGWTINTTIMTFKCVNWIDETNFTITESQIKSPDLHCSSYICANNKIYCLSTEGVFYIDILTKERTPLVSDYVFNSITLDYTGKVSFSGLDNTFNSVNGFIEEDGTINISISDNEYTVLFIYPIN